MSRISTGAARRRALGRVNGTLAFILEVSLLVVAFFWAASLFSGGWGIAAGIVLVVILVAFWSYAMAPKAAHRLRWPVQPLVALLCFVFAGVGLFALGFWPLGVLMIVIAVVHTTLSFWLRSAGS